MHLYCPVGGAFSLSFTRYTPDGHKLLVCDGIYSVTNNDGRWAIQLASTIVHEVGLHRRRPIPTRSRPTSAATRTIWPRSATATRRSSTIRRRAAGSYEPPLPVGTRTASVNFGYGPRERSRDAREGQPMDGWRTKGVKSRLAVSTRDRGEPQPGHRHQPGRIHRAGRRRRRPVRVHARPSRSARRRFTRRTTRRTRSTATSATRPMATLISETRSVGIRIYKDGHWGSAGARSGDASRSIELEGVAGDGRSAASRAVLAVGDDER